MTNNNIKNKTKTMTTFVTTVLIGMILLFQTIVIPNVGAVVTNQSQSDANIMGNGTSDTNETSTSQKMTHLVNTLHVEKQQYNDLTKQLMQKQRDYGVAVKSSNSTELSNTLTAISDIKNQIKSIKINIEQTRQEYFQLQNETAKLYYIEPTLYSKYVAIKNTFVKQIQEKYWKSKSFEQNKNTFPLVEASINHERKAVEIDLAKDIENSTKKDQYIDIINKMMPKDIPWFIGFKDYPSLTSCSGVDQVCNPLIGGIQINVGGNGCTNGFEAQDGTTFVFITAGHCGYNLSGGSTVTQPWKNGNSVGYTGNDAFSNNSACDCMLNTNNTSTDLSDAIFVSSTQTDTPTSTEAASQTSGWTVDLYGAASGNTSGTVTNTSVSVTYNVSGTSITIDDLVEASFSSICGDSGGTITDGTGAYLLGVQSGHSGASCTSSSTSYYSPIDEIESNLNITPVLN